MLGPKGYAPNGIRQVIGIARPVFLANATRYPVLRDGRNPGGHAYNYGGAAERSQRNVPTRRGAEKRPLVQRQRRGA